MADRSTGSALRVVTPLLSLQHAQVRVTTPETLASDHRRAVILFAVTMPQCPGPGLATQRFNDATSDGHT